MLAGRAAEVEAIAGALDAVARGGRRLVTVRGEAGIGKTRLLTELCEAAIRQRFVVLEGRATEFESDIPFVPVLDALAAEPPAETERWRAHRALGRRLAAAAEGRPALLVIDDVHWADPATLDLLEHLIRRPPAESLLLALGFRPSRETERFFVAQRAAAAVGLVALELRPLGRAAAEPLLTPISDPAERDRLYAQAGGNPLLLQEMGRAGGALPSSVVAAVQAEVDGLPASARSLVRAAAVAGDPFDLDLAAGIAGLGEPEALAALDGAAGLVLPTDAPRRFAFRHPVVRTAIYAALGPGERLAGHAAAARELEAAPLAIRARHLAHCARDATEATTLRAAAAAVRSHSPTIAADWLLAARRADPAGAVAGLAETLVEAGRFEEALSVVEEAGDDPGAAVAGAAVERLLGRHDAARRRLLRAPREPRVLAALAVGAYQRGAHDEMLGWARQIGPAGGAIGAVAAALLAMGGGPVEAALAAADAAPDHELGAQADLATAVTWGLLAIDRLPEGLATARRTAAAARRLGNHVAAIPHDLAAVLALGQMGRFVEAEAVAEETEQAARASANAQLVQWALWMQAWVLLERDELERARAVAEESVALAEGLDDSAMGDVARTVLGAILGARGDHDAARRFLAAYGSDPGWVVRWSPFLVESDLALGDLEAARRHARPGRAQALVALAEGDLDARQRACAGCGGSRRRHRRGARRGPCAPDRRARVGRRRAAAQGGARGPGLRRAPRGRAGTQGATPGRGAGRARRRAG